MNEVVSLQWQVLCVVVAVQGLLFNGNGKLVGFKEETPLALARRASNPSLDFKALIPEMATHANVFYFRGHTGVISFPFATYFINQTDSNKPYDMVLDLVQCAAALAMCSLKITAVTVDLHPTNLVC